MKYFSVAVFFLALSAQADVLKCKVYSWNGHKTQAVQYGELVLDSNAKSTPQLNHCPAHLSFMSNTQLGTTSIGIGTVENGFFKNFAQFEYKTGNAPSAFRLSATFPEAGTVNIYIAECSSL